MVFHYQVGVRPLIVAHFASGTGVGTPVPPECDSSRLLWCGYCEDSPQCVPISLTLTFSGIRFRLNRQASESIMSSMMRGRALRFGNCGSLMLKKTGVPISEGPLMVRSR